VTKNLELLAQISKHCAERQQEVNGLVELLSDNIVLARHDEAYELAEVLLPNAEVMTVKTTKLARTAAARTRPSSFATLLSQWKLSFGQTPACIGAATARDG
jgi:uncharacterized protein YmfQ (DUF2313 family)